MEFEIKGNPDFGEAVAQLESGDSFHAASGAMNWLRGPVSFKARLMGGLGKSLIRKVLGGTSMFVNEYKAIGPSQVAFSHMVAGTLVQMPITSEGMLIAGPGDCPKPLRAVKNGINDDSPSSMQHSSCSRNIPPCGALETIDRYL